MERLLCAGERKYFDFGVSMVHTSSADGPLEATGCAFRKSSSVGSGLDQPKEEEQVPSS